MEQRQAEIKQSLRQSQSQSQQRQEEILQGQQGHEQQSRERHQELLKTIDMSSTSQERSSKLSAEGQLYF